MGIGTQIDLDFRYPAGFSCISPPKLQSLQDLLDAVKEAGEEQPQTIGMLRSTVAQISTFLARPPQEIPIDKLANMRPELKAFLKGRGYKRNSVRSYMNYCRILLRQAEKLGWVHRLPVLPEEWETVLLQMPRDKNYAAIAMYAASKGKKPSDLTDDDLEEWVRAAILQGRTYRYANQLRSCFRGRVLRTGLAADFPNLSLHPTDSYGIPLRDFPEPLRAQVEALLNWKTAPLSFGRTGKSRLRPISARNLRHFIGRIVGFVRNVRGEDVNCLETLLTKEHLASYLEWSVNERKVKPQPLAALCGVLYAAVRTFPLLEAKDFTWMPKLVSSLPEDSYTKTKEAKERKWVDWDRLALVPKMIRNEANRNHGANPKRYALAVRDQLLIIWLLTQPWRQRNLRECKLLPREQGGNLFKSQISPLATIAKPPWARNALKSNPYEEFWQFYFREEETKTGRPVHSLLPKQLVPLLEEYISEHRPLLLKGNDPGTLFLNSEGNPLTIQSLKIIVENLTVRFAGRRVTPHLFRDIVAVKWLEKHPEDFITASRFLWHSNPSTLFKIYGRNFDESYAAQRMEGWLDEQAIDLGSTSGVLQRV